MAIFNLLKKLEMDRTGTRAGENGKRIAFTIFGIWMLHTNFFPSNGLRMGLQAVSPPSNG